MCPTISSNFDVFYCLYYLIGLIEVFGEESLTFSSIGFPRIDEHHSMALRIERPRAKIFIDARDSASINKAAFEWCDVYAKVNADGKDISNFNSGKILPIGPNFAVRVWGLPKSIWLSVYNFCKSYKKHSRTPREHFANYWRQYRYRLPISEYAHIPSTQNYVFFLSSLWKKEKTTNQYRANFIHACRDIRSLTFEGGFAPRRYKDIDGFEDYTIDRRYEFKEYLRQLKKSIVAFNTPAVESCHGWKLGEYLALGKAIISTPLKRLLPVPLAHGENIHFVDGSIMQIKDALLTIKNDNVYRHKIECNAKKYFLHYLAPRKCIERIINLLHISI